MTGFNSRVTNDESERYHIEFYTNSKEEYEFVEDACRLCIDHQQSIADPEGNGNYKAHWIDNADSYICSGCGFGCSCPAEYSDGKMCPNCGAIMVEEDLNEDS